MEDCVGRLSGKIAVEIRRHLKKEQSVMLFERRMHMGGEIRLSKVSGASGQLCEA